VKPRLAAGAALLAALFATRLALAADDKASPAQPAEMTTAQSDYIEHCGGCHGLQGSSAPADIPVLRERVGYFMCLAEGREYLIRLPNVAHATITDNDELAEMMNFVVFGLGGHSAPAGARPFTGDEVAALRQHPLGGRSLVDTRAALVKRLQQRCAAPASLSSAYPGQPAPDGRASGRFR
jgi:hypothetical protein